MRSLDILIELAMENGQWLKDSLIKLESGQYFEVKRIAVVLRTLVHHFPASNTHSLINQIETHPDNPIGKITMVDKWGLDEPATGLIALMNKNPEMFFDCTLPELPYNLSEEQLLKRFPRKCDINVWWTRPILKVIATEWSRSLIVKKYANKEGGTHVDLRDPLAFQEMSKSFVSNNPNWRISQVFMKEAGITMLYSLGKYLNLILKK